MESFFHGSLQQQLENRKYFKQGVLPFPYRLRVFPAFFKIGNSNEVCF